MESKIGFNPKWIKAAAVIAARNDIRYYLNGVLVEVLKDEARLVSTDGHRMLILRKTVPAAAPGRFIVPHDVIDMLKPHPKYKLDAEFTYNPDSTTARVTMEYMTIGIQFNPIDGKYPDYDKTLHKASVKPSGEVATFNPTYVTDFKSAAETAFGSNRIYAPVVWHNGDNPAAVTYMDKEEFFGVLMPMRMSSTYNPPKWTLPPAEEKKPEEALAA